MTRIGRLIVPEYRFQWPQLDWWNDALFNDYLRQFDELTGFNTYRRWTLFQLLRLIEIVPGDTAECGVFQGAGSYLICQANTRSANFQRHHFMFNSFAGLSAPVTSDGSYWSEGDLSSPLEIAQANLSEFKQISFHKGWIPERFSDVDNRIFAFVHIDVDLYQPTSDSISFFYSQMNNGGIIVCDDYGFSSCPGATEAVNNFLSDKPERMVALPAGGGYLIKGCVTAPI